MDSDSPPEQNARRAFVAGTVFFLCIGVSFVIVTDSGENPLAAFPIGYLPASDVWAGGYWTILTSALVHVDLVLLGFNLYWLWELGGRVERAIGHGPVLAFLVASAAVSSTVELAVSDDTGIGASGVVYALVGFMWPCRHRYGSFREILSGRTLTLLLAWMVLCIVATTALAANVGNAAHVSGFVFGLAVALAFVVRPTEPAKLLCGSLLATALVPLLWCPWSATWWAVRAEEALDAGENRSAVEYYDEVVRRSPDAAWAYWNRGIAHDRLGNAARAEQDWATAVQLDPTIDDPAIDD